MQYLPRTLACNARINVSSYPFILVKQKLQGTKEEKATVRTLTIMVLFMYFINKIVVNAFFAFRPRSPLHLARATPP